MASPRRRWRPPPTTAASTSTRCPCAGRGGCAIASRGRSALVPTRIYFKGSRAKVEIALARGKDRFDKRESIRERETKRDMQRALREANR